MNTGDFIGVVILVLMACLAGLVGGLVIASPIGEKTTHIECLKANEAICRDVTVYKTRFREVSKDGVYTITGDTNYVVHEK